MSEVPGNPSDKDPSAHLLTENLMLHWEQLSRIANVNVDPGEREALIQGQLTDVVTPRTDLRFNIAAVASGIALMRDPGQRLTHIDLLTSYFSQAGYDRQRLAILEGRIRHDTQLFQSGQAKTVEEDNVHFLSSMVELLEDGGAEPSEAAAQLAAASYSRIAAGSAGVALVDGSRIAKGFAQAKINPS